MYRLARLLLPKNGRIMKFLRSVKKIILKKKGGNIILRRMPIYDQVISSYSIWSELFDTPDSETMGRMANSKNPCSLVYVIAYFDGLSEKYAEELSVLLVNSIGQEWKGVFLFSQECKANTTMQRIRMATHSDSRITFDNLPVDPDAEFVVIIRGGALPRLYALRVFGDALRADPNALVAYSDEDYLDSNGISINPWFKPEYSPLLMKQGMLLGPMVILRINSLTRRMIFDRLAIGHKNIEEILIETCLGIGATRTVHIPHVLFHDAFGIRSPLPLQFALPDPLPTTSIVIPSKNRWDLLGPCLESIKTTDWPREFFEVLIVDNNSDDEEYLNMLAMNEELGLIRVIRDNREFNWSHLNNIAAHESQGELLVFLNNDTEVSLILHG